MSNKQKTQPLYAVVFSGKLQQGIHKADAISAFATLFKLDNSKAENVLAKSCVLKKNLNAASAKQYLSALEKTGIAVELVNQSDNPNTQQTDNQLSVLPLGSDVLTTQERTPTSQHNIDTSHIKMASAFVHYDNDNNDSEKNGYESLSIPHLTIADVGEELLIIKPKKVATKDIASDFELKPAGSELLEEHEKQQTNSITQPEISHLSLED